jgi:DNA-binding transcriptional regulator YiaG
MVTGKELKRRREKEGLSQAALAKIVRTTQATICRWETGSRKITPMAELILETVLFNKKMAS